MKKILFALAALIGCATIGYAQTSFIATLQHEGEFTHYYGAGALTAAYNAAEVGDIITLSPGTFSSPGTINKSITLRGAGVESASKTYVSSSTTFCATDSARIITVEGIKFNDNAYVQNNSSGTGQGTIKFIKCTFNYLEANSASLYSTNKGPVVRIYNCKIQSWMYFGAYSNPDFLFYNCYVENPYSSSSFEVTTTAFVNCVVNWTGYYANKAYYLNFYNTIFNWTYGQYTGSDGLLPNTATCYNCLSINQSTLFSNLVSKGNNWTAGSAADVFVTYRTSPSEGETFELTDAVKEACIGTDGTQMGMQGGNYPYNTKVQYPIITQFSSDVQTSKEGILNINVEVDGQ